MRQQAVIENPILNSPFEEPQRHFRFDEHGITSQVVEQRRPSSYFIPIAQPKKTGKERQLTIEGWTEDRIETNKTVNDIRQRVRLWRQGGYPDVTRTTARLLEHWTDPERSRRLFFCQIEALETLIYITETAKKYGDAWIENDLRQFNANANPELFRQALKMATGSGKTVVMAMLIAWQTLNKLANRQDARFTDAFLIVSPGITIRDRLRVLLPGDPQNYYRGLEIVPSDLMGELGKAQIIITNFHAFGRRERVQAAKLTKAILANGNESPFTESEGEMVRRACRGLGTKKNIIVINDEAHHCYRRRQQAESEDGEKLVGDERKEAERRDEEARIWINGLEAVKRKLGVKAVYDLSATPFFLRGSGYKEGTLFPWVVSDFSLIDAIESGVVKVPRVPVADNAMEGAMPTYRDLWLRIRDDLPKKGRSQQTLAAEPNLPAPLEGALQSLYANYAKYYQRWLANAEARADGLTPPVFIVVCNNTNVSKMVFDYIAGWEKPLPDGQTAAVPGKLPLFSNVEGDRFIVQPNTILVDSEQLESGEAMSAEFKQFAAREIEEFKADYRRRFPGRDADDLTDEDLLREVMNTVGKPGKLGEQIKCVVSVSMLTEGWDANTVTHILGVRAFGTQLLCEQVVGRGLRRMSYSTERSQVKTPSGIVEIEAFPVEYAEVYGVPFSFISSSGAGGEVKPGPQPTHVRALEDRIDREITFPRIDGYRYELPAERLSAQFDERSQLALTTAHVPTQVESAPIIGESSIHRLDDLKERREQEVVFLIAKLVLERYFRDDEHNVKPWLFPDLLAITRRWLAECVTLKDDTFKQLLLFAENAHDAADRIYQAIVLADPGPQRLLPIPKPYDTLGSTRYVSFDTIRPTYRTDPAKCHVSHVAGDTESWEQKLAETLEDMDEVRAYVKNQGLGFTIPYTLAGQQHAYIPDFIVLFDDGRGDDDLLNLILEVSGQRDKDKEAKVSTARTLWVPAVNNAGTWGRWAFIEISDPWDAKNTIRSFLQTQAAPAGAKG
ncbi:MAG TPA: DEAD/DEAH box helicase family protein [Pirellulales bacterium]|nr:DEAD/DEAH box helicase family protein [Pirellulales bacterium]